MSDRKHYDFTYTITTPILAESFDDAHKLALEEANVIWNNSAGDLRIVVTEGEPEDDPGAGNFGVFCEGCQAEVFAGIRWPSQINNDETHEWVERCDQCQRFESDTDAAEWLVENYGDTNIERFGHERPAGSTTLQPYVETI